MENSLKEKDIQLVEIVIGLFKSLYHGNDNAVKTGQLIFDINKTGVTASGQTLRHVIGHIRREDLLSPNYIISDVNTGYWLSSDEREMNDFIDKQMNRMTNQFQNLKRLHHRIRNNKKSAQDLQAVLF